MVLSILHTIGLVIIAGALVVVFTPFVTIARLINPTGKYAHFLDRMFLTAISYLIGVEVKIDGKENLEKDKSYLIIANHKSSVDILVLARALPLHFKFFADIGLFFIPFFGWCMSLAGYIPINRKNSKQAYRSIQTGTQILKDGISSILIFPEGTRSAKAEVARFKNGFIRMASETQRPILPVVLDGTSDIKPKGYFWFKPAPVRIKILPPIETGDWDKETWEKMREQIEERMRAQYNLIHKTRFSRRQINQEIRQIKKEKHQDKHRQHVRSA